MSKSYRSVAQHPQDNASPKAVNVCCPTPSVVDPWLSSDNEIGGRCRLRHYGPNRGPGENLAGVVVTINIKTRVVLRTDEPAMKLYASLLRTFLYQKSLMDPMKQITRADVIFAGVVNAEDVGFASVNRYASPDRINADGEDLWLEDSVIKPAYQGLGVWSVLERLRLEYVRDAKGRIFTTSVSSERTEYLVRNRWVQVRVTRDGPGDGFCTVFELPRAHLRDLSFY